MRLAILLMVGLFSFTSFAHADDDDTPTAAEIKMLFFGKDYRKAITDITAAPWDAIGQLETESGNLCTATLISPHLALTAGHCLLVTGAAGQLRCALWPVIMAGAMKFTILMPALNRHLPLS